MLLADKQNGQTNSATLPNLFYTTTLHFNLKFKLGGYTFLPSPFPQSTSDGLVL